MTPRFAALMIGVTLSVAACADAPTRPASAPRAASLQAQPAPNGTGLVLSDLTGLSVPLVGQLGTVNIDQAVVTNFALVENTVGQIVGLQANGVLQLTGGVLGTNVVTQNFSTTASVTSSGPGQCTIASVDLGSVGISALGLASIDVPAASITGKGSGAVGSLLCNLGQLLSGLSSGLTGSSGAQGVVNALNNVIG